jgi:AcrR family transcriptional regulator
MTEARVRRSREEQREETRRRLLDAARQTFVRRGYEASSVEEIAELAGYTRGAVYSNFRDKDELYVTVLESSMTAKLDEMRTRVDGIDDPPCRLDALRDLFVNEREDDTPILYAELQLAAARHPELRRKLRALFERHLENVGALICGSAEADETFRVLFITMFAVIEGLALQLASGNATPEIGRAARALVIDAVRPLIEAHLNATELARR